MEAASGRLNRELPPSLLPLAQKLSLGLMLLTEDFCCIHHKVHLFGETGVLGLPLVALFSCHSTPMQAIE